MLGKLTRWIRFALLVLVVLGLSAAGCGDDEEEGKYRRRRPRPKPGMSSIEAKKVIAEQGSGLVESTGAKDASGEMKLPKLSETDFIEGPKHRDPFAPAMELLVRKEKVTRAVQREIKLHEWDVSELKLIAVITNIGDPRAMVVTPNSEGFVLRRGDYVGKPDYVDPGSGGEQIQVNWRVARIHGSGKEEERGIYLVRDDPLTQTPEDVTRFIPLHKVTQGDSKASFSDSAYDVLGLTESQKKSIRNNPDALKSLVDVAKGSSSGSYGSN